MKRWFFPRSIPAWIVLVIMMVCLIWVGRRAWLYVVQRNTSAWVASYGGKVIWAAEPTGSSPKGNLIWRNWWNHPALREIEGICLESIQGPNAEDFRILARLPHLERLYLAGYKIGDDHARALHSMRHMTELRLGASSVTSEGFASLAGLTQLEKLDLSASRVSDHDMAHLSILVDLEELSLSDTDVGNEGLKSLRKLENLTYLEVDRLVTDAGIDEIVRHKKLRSIYFHESPVTNAAMDRLMQELPDLEFVSLFYTEVTGDKMKEMQDQGIRVEAAF